MLTVGDRLTIETTDPMARHRIRPPAAVTEIKGPGTFSVARNKYTLSATILYYDATAYSKSAVSLRRHDPCGWVCTRRIESSAAVVRVANLRGFKPEVSLHRQSKKR